MESLDAVSEVTLPEERGFGVASPLTLLSH